MGDELMGDFSIVGRISSSVGRKLDG